MKSTCNLTTFHTYSAISTVNIAILTPYLHILILYAIVFVSFVRDLPEDGRFEAETCRGTS
jgi:hypothetical protein